MVSLAQTGSPYLIPTDLIPTDLLLFSIYWGQNIAMKSPTNDQYHYLLGKSIFLEIFNDIYQNICLIIENIMDLVG